MPEARAGFALVAICLLAPAASAQEPARSSAAEVFHTDDPRNWGSPKRVLPPEYPAEALARRHTGYVDFQGVVTAVENIEPGKFEPDSAASAIFIEPLKRVLPHWRYHIVVGPDCLPALQPLWTRVWFELEGDKPKISVSLRDPASIPSGRQLREIDRWDPQYPRSMQVAGYQSNVFARMVVGAGGDVTDVGARAYPEAPGVDLRDFVKSTERALKRWRFPPAAPADAQRVVCKQVFFRLRD